MVPQTRLTYPYYSIPDCVGFIEKIYKQEKDSELPVQRAIDHIGLTYGSGSSDRAISCLIGYGLMDDRGTRENKMVKLSVRGKAIVLLEEEDERRIQAIREAAYSDEVLSHALEKWYFSGASKENIAQSLVLDKEWSFTERPARRFSKVIDDTINYLRLQESYESDLRNEPVEPEVKNLKGITGTDSPVGSRSYTLTLSKDKEIRLVATGILTQDDLEFIFMWLKRLDLSRTDEDIEKLNMHK